MITLVPRQFFDPAAARETLAEVAVLSDGDQVKYVEVPQYDAVLIYNVSGGEDESSLPEMFFVLEELPKCEDYNKIVLSYADGVANLAIAQGKTLLLANTYRAQDFTTAQYFLFLALKSLQLNPEVSTVCLRNDISAEDEMSLYRYFKSVERI